MSHVSYIVFVNYVFGALCTGDMVFVLDASLENFAIFPQSPMPMFVLVLHVNLDGEWQCPEGPWW